MRKILEASLGLLIFSTFVVGVFLYALTIGRESHKYKITINGRNSYYTNDYEKYEDDKIIIKEGRNEKILAYKSLQINKLY